MFIRFIITTSLVIVDTNNFIFVAMTVADGFELISIGTTFIAIARTNTQFTIGTIVAAAIARLFPSIITLTTDAVAADSVTKQIIMIKTWRNTGQGNSLNCTCARSRVLLIYKTSDNSIISSSSKDNLYNGNNFSSRIKNGITIYKNIRYIYTWIEGNDNNTNVI